MLKCFYSPSAHSTQLDTPSSRSKVTVCSWYSFVAHWQSCLVSHGKLWRAQIVVFCESAPSPLSPEEILVQLWWYSGKRGRGGQSKMLECLSAVINQTNLELAVTNIICSRLNLLQGQTFVRMCCWNETLMGHKKHMKKHTKNFFFSYLECFLVFFCKN